MAVISGRRAGLLAVVTARLGWEVLEENVSILSILSRFGQH